MLTRLVDWFFEWIFRDLWDYLDSVATDDYPNLKEKT